MKDAVINEFVINCVVASNLYEILYMNGCVWIINAEFFIDSTAFMRISESLIVRVINKRTDDRGATQKSIRSW